MPVFDENDDLNEITPLLLTNTPDVDNQPQLDQIKITKICNFPLKFVFINSIFLNLMSIAMILCERLQRNHFSFEDISIISYKTLNGFILWTSSIMFIYSISSILTSKITKISLYFCHFLLNIYCLSF
jgi:hypothetical protein